jgi:hypothetical protein
LNYNLHRSRIPVLPPAQHDTIEKARSTSSPCQEVTGIANAPLLLVQGNSLVDNGQATSIPHLPPEILLHAHQHGSNEEEAEESTALASPSTARYLHPTVMVDIHAFLTYVPLI